MDRESSGSGIEGGSSSVGRREMTMLACPDSSRPSAPVVRRAGDGVAAGLSVDRVVADGEFLAMSGWAIGGQDLTFTVASGDGVSMFPSLTFFPRDDVAAGYGIRARSRQRIPCDLADPAARRNAGPAERRTSGEPLEIDLRVPEQSRTAELAQFLTENLSSAGCLFEGLIHNPGCDIGPRKPS